MRREDGVGGLQLGPGVERQERLGGAGRSRVERDRAALVGLVEDEHDADRDLELLPLRLAEPEVRVMGDVVGHGLEAAPARAVRLEQQAARHGTSTSAGAAPGRPRERAGRPASSVQNSQRSPGIGRARGWR